MVHAKYQMYTFPRFLNIFFLDSQVNKTTSCEIKMQQYLKSTFR